MRPVVLGLAVAVALIAGWTDWRSRRIPNWLTVPGALAGLAVNVTLAGFSGLKTSLLGIALGLGLLLPFVLVRSLGAGDWKLAGALGAIVGPATLVDLLIVSIFVAGFMAFVLIIYKKRFKQSVRNVGRMIAAMASFHLPGPEVSVDSPQSLKVPYGVALTISTLLFAVSKLWGVRG